MRPLQQTPSLSNKFKIIYDTEDYFIRYKVVIETERLSIFNLSSKRSDRLELIKSLNDGGMSNSDISTYINDNGLKSIRHRSYTPKLVWGLLKKYNNRLNRFTSDRVIYKSEEICLIPKKKNVKKPHLNRVLFWIE